MTKSRWILVLASLAIAALVVSGQQAVAQSLHPFKLTVVPARRGDHPAVKEKKALYQLAAGFGVLPPLDGSGNDSWPCFGGDTDCSAIAPGGVVIGDPFYTWSLTACDASSSTFTNCGQFFNFWEDDTLDTTDDLVISVVVQQGKSFIFDSGAQNFGPNPFGTAAGQLIVLSQDTAFGTQGQSGPGNGFCAGSTETCVDPKAGPATITITTTVGTSTIKSVSKIFLE